MQSTSKPGAPKLPREAVQFAKSMGLDLDGLEPEAEDIWKMLDDMSRSNPLQYEQFVEQQLKSAKEEEGKGAPGKEKRSFRPTAGYCVETTTTAGDGLKIRDVGSKQGKTFVVNITGSVVIEEPTDNTGKPIVGTRSVADGLAIPLIVGPVRGSGTAIQSTEKDMFVDVVMHPRVLEIASKEQYFKAQIVDLALDWVIKETGVDCNRSWEFVKDCAYKGGRGESGDVPVLFFVDENGAPVGQADMGPGAAQGQQQSAVKVMSSTASLLSQLSKDKSVDPVDEIDIFAAARSKATAAPPANKGRTATQGKTGPGGESKAVDKAAAPKKPLIQEVGVEPLAPAPVVAPDPAASQAPAVVPSSSGASKGTSSHHSVKAPAESNVPPAAGVTADDVGTEESAVHVAAPTKMEYLGMEQLLSSFDDEFNAVSGRPADQTLLDLDSSNDMIANLAKVLSGGLVPHDAAGPARTTKSSGPKDGTAASAPSAVLSCLKLRNDVPAAVSVTPTTEGGPGAKEGMLCLTLSGLSSALDTAAMELLVSSEEVRVTLDRRDVAAPSGSAQEGKVSFGARCEGGGFRLREGTATAAFKKKKGLLTVKLEYFHHV